MGIIRGRLGQVAEHFYLIHGIRDARRETDQIAVLLLSSAGDPTVSDSIIVGQLERGFGGGGGLGR